MYYMGFYDLFDHLLEKNNAQNKDAATAKVSSQPNPRPFKISGRTRTPQQTTPQKYDMGTEEL